MSGSLPYRGPAPDLSAALEKLLPGVGRAIVIPRAAGHELRKALGAREVLECPLSWGTTVWTGPPDAVAVVESPNAMGRLEPVPERVGGAIVIKAAGAPSRGGLPTAMIVVAGRGAQHVFGPAGPGSLPPPDLSEHQTDFRARTASARRLGKKLNQIPGVHLAHGPAESPSFVVLFPGAPEAVLSSATEAAGSAISAGALPGGAGLPGAALVTVRAPDTGGAHSRWVEAVGVAMRVGGRGAA